MECTFYFAKFTNEEMKRFSVTKSKGHYLSFILFRQLKKTISFGSSH